MINTQPGFRLSTRLDEFLPRNKTPPYVSSIADVKYVDLSKYDKDGRFLLMCSDGLVDLYMYDEDKRDLNTLEEIVDAIVPVVGNGVTNGEGNVALHLLRDAFGGDDEDKVSRNLTVEMEEKWMDDVTVLVQSL